MHKREAPEPAESARAPGAVPPGEDRPSALVAILTYAGFATTLGVLLIAVEAPASLVTLGLIPLLLAPLGYPRRVWLTMIGCFAVLCVAVVLNLPVRRVDYWTAVIACLLSIGIADEILGRVVRGRERASASLTRREADLRQLLEAAPVALVAERGGSITYANPAACRLIGVESAAELSACTLDRFLDPAEPGGESEHDAGLQRLTRLDGETREVRVVESALAGDADPTRLSALVDLTVPRRAERELREQEDQGRRSQQLNSLGRLAGGLAHDFNNLLTVIRGNLDLIHSAPRTDDPGAELLAERLDEIALATERAEAMTRQLIAFGRRPMKQSGAIGLAEVMGPMETILRRLIGRGIDLRVSAPPDTGRVQIDRPQVEQVILNLVLNARDAMPEGGMIRIELENLPAVAGTGPWVALRVTDQGEAIPTELRERIFEPFYSTHGHGKGSGLGLSLVYGIVRGVGGRVRVEGLPEGGSCIHVEFPRADPVGPEVAPATLAPRQRIADPGSRRSVVSFAPERAPGTPSHRRGDPALAGSIVLCDDEPGVRKLTQEGLEYAGYRVRSFPDGEAAVAYAHRTDEPVDLLITDVVMPGMNGRAVAEAFTAVHPEARVLYISGYPDETVAKEGLLEEGIDFLSKPFLADGLLERVRSALARPG